KIGVCCGDRRPPLLRLSSLRLSSLDGGAAERGGEVKEKPFRKGGEVAAAGARRQHRRICRPKARRGEKKRAAAGGAGNLELTASRLRGGRLRHRAPQPGALFLR